MDIFDTTHFSCWNTNIFDPIHKMTEPSRMPKTIWTVRESKCVSAWISADWISAAWFSGWMGLTVWPSYFLGTKLTKPSNLPTSSCLELKVLRSRWRLCDRALICFFFFSRSNVALLPWAALLPCVTLSSVRIALTSLLNTSWYALYAARKRWSDEIGGSHSSWLCKREMRLNYHLFRPALGQGQKWCVDTLHIRIWYLLEANT